MEFIVLHQVTPGAIYGFFSIFQIFLSRHTRKTHLHFVPEKEAVKLTR